MEKIQKKVIIVIAGILMNLAGVFIADFFQLPVWLSASGTFLITYWIGPWCGAIAGFLSMLALGIYDATALVYLITGPAAAMLMHAFLKNGYISSLLRALIFSFWLGILCTLVVTPLCLLFLDGYSGNIWGDTVVDMLRWHEFAPALTTMVGVGMVEILDKQICMLIAALAVWMTKRWEKKKNRQQAVLLLAAGVLVSTSAFPIKSDAAEQNVCDYIFQEQIYNNANGMVSSEANIICETDDGCIWVGSYAGLTRYDGSQFTFVREGGLVNVVGMMKDSKGRLWIGTNDAGIARYENGAYTYFSVTDGLPSNSIRCFAEAEDGTVYVGTSDKICKFGADDTIEVLKQDITFVKDMVVYADMLVVMDNKGDIYAINGAEALTISEAAAENYFYYCLGTSSKGLLAGTENGGLLVFDITEKGLVIKEKIEIAATEISAVFEDSKKRIWVATEWGFGHFDAEGNYHKMYYDEFASSIVCFLEDYQGNIWLASSNYGVMKLSETPFENIFERAGLTNEIVNAVTLYKGDYYCGTDNGLIILNSEMSVINNTLTELTRGYRIRSLYVDTANRLWLCTYSGLLCYDGQDVVISLDSEEDGITSSRFRCITELPDGMLVAGTADGINFIRNGRVTGTLTAADGLANTQILSVVPGNDGTVWAGSDGSGIYVISEGKLVKNYTVKDGLSSDVILRIIPYENGYFVVTSNALCHVDRQGNISRLSNFPYFNNYDIIISGEIAYITCSAGLYEMPLAKLCADECEPYLLYGAKEGLIYGLTANSWNYLAEDGSLFLCSNSGVILCHTGKAQQHVDLKFGVVSVECDGENIEIGADNSIIIPSDTKNLSIYASVRNYGFSNEKVRLFIKELDTNPKIYNWNEIEPIKMFKPEDSKYNICLQILDGIDGTILQEKTYRVSKEMQAWEKPGFKTYLILVSTEIILFTIISIVSIILFVIRKNELERHQVELEKKVAEQTAELRSQQAKMKELFVQTITALSEAVDAKDRYTSGHSKRVAEYARMIAARLGKSKEEQEEIYRAGLLHDVGKIRIPVDIINKPGRLTEEEYNLVKLHSVTGYHILRGIDGSNMIAIAAKYHHERFDGKGYPNGLEGEKIPEMARILGVADSYDAMTSNRSYRNALPQEVVRSEIEKGRGTQFDSQIADIMLQMMDEDLQYTMKQKEAVMKKILVVDDDAMTNKLIEHIMKDEAMYQVVSVGGGREALEIMEQQKFDLILLDVYMPDMDGLETLRRIREKYQTPVVLLTGDKTLDTSAEFATLGCDDYITKPFLPLLIKEVVHNMLERMHIDNE